MAQVVLNSVRQLASQKSFKLYQDQYDRIERIEKSRNIELNKAELVREGIDLVLNLIESNSKGDDKDGI